MILFADQYNVSIDEIGTYYVEVHSGTNSGDYILHSSVTVADDFTNDTSTTGRLAIGGSATGQFETEDDQDWFLITINTSAFYQFYIEQEDSSDASIILRDSSGNFLAGGTSDNSIIEIPFNSYSYGDLYLDVNSNGNLGNYVVHALILDSNDADDFSDNINTNGLLTVGGSATGTIENNGPDSDWFQISINNAGTYQFNIEQIEFLLNIEDEKKFSVIIPKDASMNALFENNSFIYLSFKATIGLIFEALLAGM